jgi:diguanylate cyclase
MIAIAEGVEGSGDLEALVEMGCDAAQGFTLAPPMEREEFKRWLGRV